MKENKNYIEVKSPLSKKAILLNTELPLEDKKKIVEDLIEQHKCRENATIWETDGTRYFVEALTNYLLTEEKETTFNGN